MAPAIDDAGPPVVDTTLVDSNPTLWLEGYAYRRSIVIATEQTVTLDDFVVAIRLASDTALADHALDNGSDLVITDKDGAILDYEIELFDEDTGELAGELPQIVAERLRRGGLPDSLQRGAADPLAWARRPKPGDRTTRDGHGELFAGLGPSQHFTDVVA